MQPVIRLTVKEGSGRTRRFCFRGKTACVVGRARDCEIQLEDDAKKPRISRHHCKLEIDVPFIRVIDLGSKHGTWIDGKRLGPETPAGREEILKNGDVLRVGDTAIQMDVMLCPPPFECEEEVWREGQSTLVNCNVLC